MLSELGYYWKLQKKSRSFVVDLASKKWCDLYHQHFDWDGKGNEGRVHRVRHINAHLRALRKARIELQGHVTPYQLFAYIDLKASENDAVYIHTPNPNGTAFPAELSSDQDEVNPPPLLACRIDRGLFKVIKSSAPDSNAYYVVSRTSEA
ncbi:MAG: hypothetical protein KBC73_07625 [Burkholderiaceae bacterium]|nr:hypothetical protein [Burkholderiaceae bacterium]